MKNLIIISFALLMVSCGTKYNYNDTGTSNPRFDGDMYEYLQSNNYDWSMTVELIDRAQLGNLFRTGDITFMGLTNHSIRKWLIKGGDGFEKYGYEKVSDIPADVCRTLVLSHVIEGKMLRDQIERAVYDEKGQRVGGGRVLTTHRGNKLWLWTRQDPYMGVPGVGPVDLSMTAMASNGTTEISTNRVAAGDMQPDNGVVHALQYSYNISDIGSLIVD